MMGGLRLNLSKGTLIRIAADALMVNGALFLASALRFVAILSSPTTPASAEEMLGSVTHSYLGISVFLTPIALSVFATNGFYTHGRAYRGRYKALVVVQAVTLVYLILGSLSYFHIVPLFYRGTWLAGLVLTVAMVAGARVFAAAWVNVVRWEDRLLRQKADAPIRRVLVIGGAGYVGAALLRQLLAQGYAVRVLDRLLYGESAMAELRSDPRFEFFHGDFRNIESVVRCMQDVDAVVHLGAIVGDPAGDLEPEVTNEVNVAATRLIADIARGYGVRRFVFTSTCSVYGASDQVLDERSAVNALSLYARTKLASEKILLDMTDTRFSPVILRLGTLYGLSYRPRFDLVVNLLAAQAVLEGKISVEDGEQWRPFLHVEDAARAIVSCLNASAAIVAGQIFNVGATRENHQLKDIARMVSHAVPGTRVQYVQSGDSRRNYHVSCEKIAQWLGFHPTRTVPDGILEIKEAIDRGEIRDYAASEYSNFKFLSESAAALNKVIEPRYAHLVQKSARPIAEDKTA
jgi:nucleoside-diphosphate-sugar epimerase